MVARRDGGSGAVGAGTTLGREEYDGRRKDRKKKK
jgi:hypothetical protein